jgi:glycosyltransferase involved in cell wall biosynthesis
MKMVYLPSLEHKAFSTLSHSLLAVTHASLAKNDLVFVVNAANGMFGFIPRLLGKPCVLNVDGMEWLRPKWNKLAKWIFHTSAKLGTKFYHEIVTDADEMHRLYAKEFGIDSEYIAYGANIEASSHPEVLAQYGLTPRGYYLIASRLIPDNNADLIVEAFAKSGSTRQLAIAGGADYKGNAVEQAFIEKLKTLGNDRVKFLGHVNSTAHVKELHCNCYAYVHGHQFGGINPSLLKALGFGNAILALNTPFNAEVLDNGKYGVLFNRDVGDLTRKIAALDRDEARAVDFRRRAPDRIRERFTWDQITDQYETLFRSLLT